MRAMRIGQTASVETTTAPLVHPATARPNGHARPTRAARFLIPDIIFGIGVLGELGQVVRRQGGGHVFVVSDPGVVCAGWAGQALTHLAAAGVEAELWIGLTPNPKDHEVRAGAQAYRDSQCDVIVAVGGGSCIDAAKAIAILACQGGSILDYAGVDKVSGPLPPTVMVPTTSGSGSDVSQFCVVTDTARRIKATIGGRALVPDVSLTDPRTLTTVAPDIAAYTALDALSHAVEAYVSKAANFLSDTQAIAAMRGVAAHLMPVLEDPGNLNAHEGLARASLHAGLAFTNGLLGATHAISHQIGGLTDLPHGLLNSIMLPHVMEFNAPVAADRLRDVAEALGASTGGLSSYRAADTAIELVRELAAKAGLPTCLGELGVAVSQIDHIARNALDDAYIVTNPRSVAEEDVRALCRAAW